MDLVSVTVDSDSDNESTTLSNGGPQLTGDNLDALNEYYSLNGMDGLNSLIENPSESGIVLVPYQRSAIDDESYQQLTLDQVKSYIEFKGGTYVSDPLVSGSDLLSQYNIITPVGINNSNVFKAMDTGQFQEVEIRPDIRRAPNEIPFLIRMVDSDLKNAAIYLNPDIVVTGIKLAPNPDTFSISSTKIVNRYNSMTRWVEECWGDDMDTVSFSGSTFSFTAYKLQGIPDVGLTVKYSRDTKAYIFLRELIKVMEYNGLVFQDDITYSNASAQQFLSSGNSEFIGNHPLAGTVRERLYVNVFYDYVSFLGHFESFDIMETSDNPFRNTYSCIFKSERTKYYRTKY
jgi:hypothetical protein